MINEEYYLLWAVRDIVTSVYNKSSFIRNKIPIYKSTFNMSDINEVQKEKALSSPALTHQSKHYPSHHVGKVPYRVKMKTIVRSIFAIGPIEMALEGHIYPVWVNSNGGTAVIFHDGNTLGVCPEEYEVVEYHQ